MRVEKKARDDRREMWSLGDTDEEDKDNSNCAFALNNNRWHNILFGITFGVRSPQMAICAL